MKAEISNSFVALHIFVIFLSYLSQIATLDYSWREVYDPVLQKEVKSKGRGQEQEWQKVREHV